MATGERWHALEVTIKEEKRIARRLAARGFEAFLPGHAGDRDRPLFDGVVFCRFRPQQRPRVLETKGVLSVLAMAGDGSADQPVSGLRRLIDSGRRFQPWRRLRSGGDPVLVEAGPLEGLSGRLKAFPCSVRVVLVWEGLQPAVAVDLEGDPVRFLPQASGSALLN